MATKIYYWKESAGATKTIAAADPDLTHRLGKGSRVFAAGADVSVDLRSNTTVKVTATATGLVSSGLPIDGFEAEEGEALIIQTSAACSMILFVESDRKETDHETSS